jgi:hypothetical protein
LCRGLYTKYVKHFDNVLNSCGYGFAGFMMSCKLCF